MITFNRNMKIKHKHYFSSLWSYSFLFKNCFFLLLSSRGNVWVHLRWVNSQTGTGTATYENSNKQVQQKFSILLHYMYPETRTLIQTLVKQSYPQTKQRVKLIRKFKIDLFSLYPYVAVPNCCWHSNSIPVSNNKCRDISMSLWFASLLIHQVACRGRDEWDYHPRAWAPGLKGAQQAQTPSIVFLSWGQA